MNDILVFCDASGTNIKSLDYVRGWDRPLEKALVSAIAPGKPSTIDFTVSINEYFEQVRRELDQGSSGPSAFRLLLRLLADQFDSGDNQESFLRLQSFGVSDGTPFSTYLRAFRLLVSSVSGTERALAPSVSMVLEIVRNSVMKQFPTLSPLLYPGTLATAVTPFDSIIAMWEAFAPLTTNQTPAMSGANYFSLPQATSSSQPRRSSNRNSMSFGQSSSNTARNSMSFVQGGQGSSNANPIVMSVSSSPDPFTNDYAAWPATHEDWPEVYQVSSSF